jgi:hypothetical protein
MRAILLPLLVMPLLSLSTAWAQPATIVRTTELKKSPATDAPTVAELAPTTLVEALERRGGWTRVKAREGEGWVKMLALRYGATGPGARRGDSGLSQLFNVARTGSSGTQVTTGVRGLEAEQIANAAPNAAELKRMQQFAASPEAAAKFAAQGKLQPVSVEEPQ